MEIKNTFRILLLVSVILPIAGIVLTLFNISSEPEDIQNLIAWDGYNGIFWTFEEPETSTKYLVELGSLLIFILFIIIAYIGLFLFKPWSKPLIIVVTIASLALVPLTGVTVVMPIPAMLNEISSIVYGAILCMLYIGPLSNEFNKT